jgi:RNA polymerase sigma factor (sigma-70 family)
LKENETIYNLRQGDKRKALKGLYTSYFKKVERLVINRGGNSADAEDVFQESVMVFYEKVTTNKLTEDNCNVGGYLMTVSKNIWLNKLKKEITREKYHNRQDLETIHEDDFKRLVDKEQQNILNQVLNTLGEKCKTILKHVAYDGYTMKEISEKMGFASVDVAKTAHYRCKKKMIDFVKSNKQLMAILSGNEQF